MNYFNQALDYLRENNDRLTQFAEERTRSVIQDGVTAARDQLQAAAQDVDVPQVDMAIPEVDMAISEVDMAIPEGEQVQEDDIQFINLSPEEEEEIVSRGARALDYLIENRDRLRRETIHRITDLVLARIPDKPRRQDAEINGSLEPRVRRPDAEINGDVRRLRTEEEPRDNLAAAQRVTAREEDDDDDVASVVSEYDNIGPGGGQHFDQPDEPPDRFRPHR